MGDLETLAGEIRTTEGATVLTGAGISAPSGVPTFRGEDGIWDRFEEGQFAYGRFRRDPEGFWRDRLELRRAMYGEETYEPNAAHRALAELGRRGHLDAIVTQNTDGLHGAAAREVGGELDRNDGASVGADEANLVELHGNSRRVRCTECERRHDARTVQTRVADGDVPPYCDCGGLLKPDVVLFGERLPATALQRAQSLASGADVFLAVGSSLEVEPAASLPRIAARNGATVAVVNLEETPVDDLARHVFRADVTEILPALRDELVDADAAD
nr:NAD-dependent deacylase [Halovivax sp.]